MEQKNYSYDIGIKPKKWDIPKNYHFYRTSRLFKIERFCILLMPVIIYYLYLKVRYKIKFTNKKKALKIIKEKGAVLICNHILPSDAASIIITLFPRLIYTPMLKSNMGFFVVSKIFRLAGCVPIPESISDMRNFDKQTKDTLNKNLPILFMAEGSLELFCDHIRPFSKGPFRYAYEEEKPIIPVCITTRKKDKKVIKLYVNFLDEFKINKSDNKRLDIEQITVQVNKIMTDFYNKENALLK